MTLIFSTFLGHHVLCTRPPCPCRNLKQHPQQMQTHFLHFTVEVLGCCRLVFMSFQCCFVCCRLVLVGAWESVWCPVKRVVEPAHTFFTCILPQCHPTVTACTQTSTADVLKSHRLVPMSFQFCFGCCRLVLVGASEAIKSVLFPVAWWWPADSHTWLQDG